MKKINRRGLLISIVLVTGIVTACSGTRSVPSDAFLAPISDQTVDLIGEVHFGLQLADSVQLNYYLNTNTPSVDVWTAQWEDMVSAMRAIVFYSLELVDLAEVAEGAEVIEPLIEVISVLDSEIRALSSAQAYLGDLDTNSVFAKMREAQDVTTALRVAQPLMSDYSDILREMLGAANQALDDAILEVTEMVDATHAPMLAYGKNLTARQNSTLGQLEIMDRVWSGDVGAWAELMASDWALSSDMGKDVRLSPANARLAEQYLVDRLGTVATIRQQLESALSSYQAEVLELYQIEDDSKATLRVILLIIDNWEKALAQLANGEKGAFSAFTSSLMTVMYSAAARRVVR